MRGEAEVGGAVLLWTICSHLPSKTRGVLMRLKLGSHLLQVLSGGVGVEMALTLGSDTLDLHCPLGMKS